jgi:hypothetical protein
MLKHDAILFPVYLLIFALVSGGATDKRLKLFNPELLSTEKQEKNKCIL